LVASPIFDSSWSLDKCKKFGKLRKKLNFIYDAEKYHVFLNSAERYCQSTLWVVVAAIVVDPSE